MPVRLLQFLPLLAVLIWAAVQDFRTRRIANYLTFPLLAAGVARAIVAGGGAVEQCMLGILLGFGLTFVLFAMRALGGGDVKLLAAIGAWLGPWTTLGVFAVAAIIGMGIVVLQAGAQGRLGILLRNSALLTLAVVHVDQFGMQNVVDTGTASESVRKPLPYAVPIFAATVFILLRGYLI